MNSSTPATAAPPVAAPTQPDRDFRRRLGTFVILTSLSFNMLLLSAISPILSTIAAHFGSGGTAALKAQSIITFSGIGIMIGGPMAGWLGDRLGLRRLLVMALTLYGITGSAGLYLDSAGALLASRLLQGMASAGIGTATFAMLGNRFDGAARARFLGYQGAFIAAAGAVTLLLTGEIARIGGWRAPFALYLSAFLMIGIVLLARFPETAAPDAKAAPRRPSSDLLRLWPSYLMIVPMYIAAYMFYLQLSFVLAGDGVTSPVIQSRILTAITIMSVVGGLFYGRIVERVGAKWILVLILGTMAASNFAVGVSHGIAAAVIACGLAGLGGGGLGPYVTNLILGQASMDLRGRAMGFLYMAMYIGDFMNPLIVTPMRGLIGNHGAFTVVGVLLATAAAAQAIFRRGRAASGLNRIDV
jgi:MFS family permease